MIAAFIQERGVTVCPPRTAEASYQATANGHETPDSFLFRESSAAQTPEQRLAVAKILRMLQDLAGKSHVGASERFKVEDEASRWFFNPSGTTDFELWCEMAGFDAEVVRQKAREVRVNGFHVPPTKKTLAMRVYKARWNSRKPGLA
jgi:hypothetical protein